MSSNRRGPGRRRALLLVAVAVAGATIPGPLSAQWRQSQDGPVEFRPALLERRAPVENLLKRAINALQRSDWKLAIDSLQRVLEDPGGALLRVEGSEPQSDPDESFVYYESAQFRAVSLLASMPREGIEAYRVLYDGKAQALFARALSDMDEHALGEVVDRYLISSFGDDAAEVLAGWHLDRSNPVAALALLDRIDEWCADSDVPAVRVGAKRAVAWLAIGDQDRAEQALREMAGVDGAAADAALRRVEQLVNDGWHNVGVAAPTGSESWPTMGGDPLRRGRMPAVAPELRGNLPWRFALPSDDADWWETYCFNDLGKQRALPVAVPVVSEGRVFVKSLRQVVALDLESLDLLWETEAPLGTTAAWRWRRPSADTLVVEDVRYSDRERYLYDYVGAALTVAAGRVFSIEREGRGTTGRLDRYRLHDVVLPPPDSFQGTRLVAWSVEDGEVAWERGRTGDSDDPLGSVEFLSVPIEVASELWVVYLKDRDLYLGALLPESGELARKVLLCSVDGPQVRGLLHEAVYPAHDAGCVYISAGIGLVLAIDVDHFALRWATQYPRNLEAESSLEPPNWFCGPTVLSDTLVLAAPPDSEYLLALDRGNGRVRWTQRRPGPAMYILASDEGRVWLGGEQMYCLSLENGAPIWGPQPGGKLAVTARAVLTGPRILVPSLDGLIILDADSGNRLGLEPLPADQLPLGNLVCVASAAICVDTNEVRKFPDLTLSYPKEHARHEADPADEQAAIRLAWMELLRGEPKRAYTVLEKVRDSPASDTRHVGDITRLRVDALLGMARDEDPTLEQAIQYLREAVSLTRSDHDRMRATMALAAKLREAGRREEAYLSLWSLGLTSAGDGYVTVEPKLRNKSRQVIGEVLARFERELTARELRNIAERSQAAFAEAVLKLNDSAARAESVTRLRQLAELNDAGGAGQAALVALARWERDRGRFERSEQYFRAAIRQGRVARTTATALRDLAEQYLSEQQGFHFEAAKLVDGLERDYAELAIPAGESSSAGPPSADVTVAAEVQRLGSHIDPRLLADGMFVDRAGRFELIKTPATGIVRNPPPLLLVDHTPGLSEAASSVVLMYAGGNRVQAYHNNDGSLAWSTELRLPGAQRTVADHYADPEEPDLYPRALCDGQTAVMNASDALFAFGLESGRRLWAAGYEDPETADRFALRNRLVAVENGRLVWAPRRGILASAQLVDGEDLSWERVLVGEKLDSVLIRDDYCLTLANLDDTRQRATTYDVANGRVFSQIDFEQPRPADAAIPLIYTNGHLVGPDGADGMLCYNARSGQQNWKRALHGELRWLFRPDEGMVGAVCIGGRILVVDVLTGDVELDTAIEQAQEGYAEGVLHEGRLVLMPIRKTSRGDEPSLVCVELRTGVRQWMREGFGVTGADRYALWRLLDAAEEVLPMFFRIDVDDENSFTRAMGEIGVEIIDKTTGAIVGPTVMTGHSASINERLTGDFGIWPGRMVIGTHEAMLSLEITGELRKGRQAVHRRGRLP